MIIAVELDFANKLDRRLPIGTAEDLKAADESIRGGNFCWIDFCSDDVHAAIDWLVGQGVDRSRLDEITQERPLPYFIDLEECLYFTLLEADWQADGVISESLGVFMGTHFLVTVHRRASPTIDGMQRSYSRNFRRIALSPGFLLFELADHLAGTYAQVVGHISDDTQVIEDRLFQQADETIFARVASLIRSITEFYKTVMFSREIIHNLALSRSPFIPETTQPYLERKAALLDRLCADVTSEREVLSETVNLYLGIVSHTTNRFLSRLTMLGTIFLPLSFLASVYGMNSEHIPELKSQFFYFGFWIVVFSFGLSTVVYMKRKGWL